MDYLNSEHPRDPNDDFDTESNSSDRQRHEQARSNDSISSNVPNLAFHYFSPQSIKFTVRHDVESLLRIAFSAGALQVRFFCLDRGSEKGPYARYLARMEIQGEFDPGFEPFLTFLGSGYANSGDLILEDLRSRSCEYGGKSFCLPLANEELHLEINVGRFPIDRISTDRIPIDRVMQDGEVLVLLTGRRPIKHIPEPDLRTWKTVVSKICASWIAKSWPSSGYLAVGIVSLLQCLSTLWQALETSAAPVSARPTPSTIAFALFLGAFSYWPIKIGMQRPSRELIPS